MLREKDIINSYNYCKRRAAANLSKGNYNKCLEQIELSSNIAYLFNWIYTDDQLEEMLKTISISLLNPIKNYKPIANRYVFYDTFSTDNRALTQQYIRALIKMGVEFLYITTNSPEDHQGRKIFKELNEYKRVELFTIPQAIKRTEQIKETYNKIISFRPEKVIIQTHPWSVQAATILYALPNQLTRYKVNLTDNAFWIGTKCVDYILEFRSRGYTISMENRGISPNKLLIVPYYPITDSMPFQGFPTEAEEGKIIVLSGGSVYKVYGKDYEYFKLVKQLIKENQNIVLLYAGAGNMEPMKKFIKENNLTDSVFLLGNRRDINEVFKHCDIYLGTYPIAGGLMTQLAAINSKPILSYTSPDLGGYVESVICVKRKTKLTHTKKSDFFSEAKKLIEDKEYRIRRGKEIYSCIINKDEFEKQFAIAVTKHKSCYENSYDPINVDSRFRLNLEVENKFQSGYKKLILNAFSWKTPVLFPKVFIWFVSYFVQEQDWNMIIRKISGKKVPFR